MQEIGPICLFIQHHVILLRMERRFKEDDTVCVIEEKQLASIPMSGSHLFLI